MPFDLSEVLTKRQGENFRLHSDYVNPQMARVLKTIGFDRLYDRGEGCYLFDSEGRRYLDFLSGFGVFALGRGHPAVKQALHDALDADLPNLVQMDCALLPGLLAEALVARSHAGIERVVFTNSGAEAIEAAIKFARHFTGRDRILYRDHGFHGLTTGALSLNGGKEFRDGFGPLLPSAEVPFGDIDALAAALAGGDVAAFVVEPIQGKGVNLATRRLLARRRGSCAAATRPLLRHATRSRPASGRTGRFFCHRALRRPSPDIITVSKALSGGYVPVGAMLASQDLRQRLQLAWTAPWSTPRPSREPAGHGGRARHPAGLRRRGHRRPRRGDRASPSPRPWPRSSSATSSSTKCAARA